MLLHDYVFVSMPAESVCARIRADHGAWLSGLAAGAADEGETLRVRVGPIGALPMLSKTVTLHADQPIERGELTVIPLTWRATGTQGVFPVLNADLEVAPISPEVTQLTLRGTYQPPLGGLGQRLDRLLMHRIAEATVRSFMRRLAESLAASDVGEPAPPPDQRRQSRQGRPITKVANNCGPKGAT